ncbi:hypothetical protein SUGI_0071540 [Cryptomeria japonica]|nr:hypothetical protein SUGI_0071540 [Cryptomeria japonica]
MASISTTSGRTDMEPANACQGMAPSSSSSPPSSSQSLFSCCLDWVSPFLSWHSMESDSVASTSAFLDLEVLEYGDFLPTTIEAAIRGANLHIAIFSESYAESAWFLDELSLMLKSGAKIVPIFYYVEPSDLRYVAQGKGKYVAAFNKHEKKRRYKPEKLQEWKKALSEVSLDEMRLFKNMVNIVLKEICDVPLIVAKHPVGLNETVEDFEKTLQLIPGDQGVQIVDIWGMGG